MSSINWNEVETPEWAARPAAKAFGQVHTYGAFSVWQNKVDPTILWVRPSIDGDDGTCSLVAIFPSQMQAEEHVNAVNQGLLDSYWLDYED